MSECRACGHRDTERVVDLGKVPALVGAMWDDPHEAREVLPGRLDLHVCRRCAHVQNDAFDADLIDYDVDYDNSLHHSPTFRLYADELAVRLVEERGIQGMHVVEIGSGKADFLAALCRLGDNTGTGYDPTVDPALRVDGVELISDYFDPEVHVEPYDLLVCRHVLEHLDDPASLLKSLRAKVGDDSQFYFEVPSAEFNFGPDGLWDCIYPHVSYFSAQSLAALLRRSGFDVVDSGRSFSGQFLWVEVRPADADYSAPTDIEEQLGVVDGFGERWSASTAHWRKELGSLLADGHQVALWGAGSKGVNFLNAVDDQCRISVVDVNPNKWGRFLPGTGHRVDDPASLTDRGVTKVIITNHVYRDEISRHLLDIGVRSDVLSA